MLTMTPCRTRSADISRRRIPFALTLAAIPALVLGGCAGLPGPFGSDRPEEVGEVVSSWRAQDQDHPDITGMDTPAVLADDAELEQWLTRVPSEQGMRAELTSDVEFDGAVVLAASHLTCEDTMVAVTDGQGRLAAASRSDSDEQVECAWSPLEVVLFRIDLRDLGVEDAEQVELVDEIA